MINLAARAPQKLLSVSGSPVTGAASYAFIGNEGKPATRLIP